MNGAPRRGLVAAAVLGVTLTVPAIGYFRLRLPVNGKRRSLLEQFVRDMTKCHTGRPWERGPMRGAPEEGNTAEAALAAGAALRAAAPRVLARLEEAIRERAPDDTGRWRAADEALDALSAEAQVHLDALVRAPRKRRARTDLPLGEENPYSSPDHRVVVAAAQLALARAPRNGPQACVETSADIVRIGQDLVLGASVEGLAHSWVLGFLGVMGYVACIPSASDDRRSVALAELARLVRTQPPVGDAMEVKTLVKAALLRESTENVPLTPTDSRQLTGWQTYREMVDAWQQIGTDPRRWHALNSMVYPRFFSVLSQQLERMATSSNEILRFMLSNYEHPYLRDAEARCALRSTRRGRAGRRARREVGVSGTTRRTASRPSLRQSVDWRTSRVRAIGRRQERPRARAGGRIPTP